MSCECKSFTARTTHASVVSGREGLGKRGEEREEEEERRGGEGIERGNKEGS